MTTYRRCDREDCLCTTQVLLATCPYSLPQMALELLTEAAQHPECDELFRRIPVLSPAEQRAMIAKRRADRAAWGDATAIAEDGT